MPFISNLKKQTHNLLILHSLQVGEKIRVILDCDDNTLAFERNYEFLGVAFRGEFNKNEKINIIHSLIRGVLIQSCPAGAKNFSN